MPYRSGMASLATLHSYRDKLQKAYYSGARKVKVDGVETEFDTGEAMLLRLRQIEREIDRAMGVNRRPRSATIDMGGF